MRDRLAGVAVAAMLFALLPAAAALAAAPGNDSFAGATPVTGIPFEDVVDVSEATVESDQAEAPGDCHETQDYRVWIEKNPDDKCVRCWHQREDVGQSTEHPELCGRCIENVAGDGEERRLA